MAMTGIEDSELTHNIVGLGGKTIDKKKDSPHVDKKKDKKNKEKKKKKDKKKDKDGDSD
jgi:hypothetical protein